MRGGDPVGPACGSTRCALSTVKYGDSWAEGNRDCSRSSMNTEGFLPSMPSARPLMSKMFLSSVAIFCIFCTIFQGPHFSLQGADSHRIFPDLILHMADSLFSWVRVLSRSCLISPVSSCTTSILLVSAAVRAALRASRLTWLQTRRIRCVTGESKALYYPSVAVRFVRHRTPSQRV